MGVDKMDPSLSILDDSSGCQMIVLDTIYGAGGKRRCEPRVFKIVTELEKWEFNSSFYQKEKNIPF